MNDIHPDDWHWSNRIENLAPETYQWSLVVEEVSDEEFPDDHARRSAVVELVAEHSGIPESAAEEVVGHAINNQRLAEKQDGSVVYIPEHPGWELGDSYE